MSSPPVYQRRFAPPDPYERLNLQLRLQEIQQREEAMAEERRDRALGRTLDAVSGGMSSRDAVTAFGAELPANLIPVIQQIEKQRKQQESAKAMEQGLEPAAVGRFASAVQPTVTPRGQVQPVDESAAWAGAYPPGLAPEDEPAFTAALLAARQGVYSDAQARVGERKFTTNEQVRASAASSAIAEAADKRMVDYRARSAEEQQYVTDAATRLASAGSADAVQTILGDIARNTGKNAGRAIEFAMNAAAARRAEAAGKGDMAAGYAAEYGLTPIEAREVVEGKRSVDPATGLFILQNPEQRKVRAQLTAAASVAVDVRTAANDVARAGAGYVGSETVEQFKSRVGAQADPLLKRYTSLRDNYRALLLQARSGAAFSQAEFELYDSLLPKEAALRFRDGQLDPATQEAFNALELVFQRQFEAGLDPRQVGKVSTDPQAIALLRAARRLQRGEITIDEYRRGLESWRGARNSTRAAKAGAAALDAMSQRVLSGPAAGGE